MKREYINEDRRNKSFAGMCFRVKEENKKLFKRVKELEECLTVKQEEIQWGKELLASRTRSLYQMIQEVQDAVQDISREEEDDDGSLHK